MISNKITDLLFNINFNVELPPQGIEVMNPFTDKTTQQIVSSFYHKYYSDKNTRYCIIGINPGRLGGGITGIPFTDPIRLETVCGIANNWPKKQELSSAFIYEMIKAFGGAEKFYSSFYFNSISLLGFTRDGKNLNYYDDKILAERIIPFAVEYFQKQIAWGLHTNVAFCLGEGENYKFLRKLNEQYKLFGNIVPLPHPRFIMQYKLKMKDVFIQRYFEQLYLATQNQT